MPKLLYAVSALALSVGLVTAAEAASLRGADVNMVNIAVNVVPANLPFLGSDDPTVAIDGSINVSARLGGSVGHQGWHEQLDLGTSETFAIGAVNQANTCVGRDYFVSSESVAGGGFIDAAGFSVEEITHIDVHEDGFFNSQGAHYFDVDGVDYWAVRGGLAFAMHDDFAGSFVPETNVINAAINLENIDGSANYAAGFGGEIGNIGAISTSAIGALNVSTTAIGVRGSLGDLGLGD